MSQPIRVLITGVGGGSIGSQVCKALHLGSHQHEVVVTNTTKSLMAIAKAKHYEVLPPATSDIYMDSLLALINKYRIQFLIPGSEPELVKISQCRDTLSHTGVHILINANDVIATCVDKIKAINYLSVHGIRVPKTFEISNIAELEKLNANFPYIVKPSQGGGGSAATFLAQDMHELQFFVDYLLQYGYRPLAQEYIGSAENEYTVGVLHMPDGTLAGTVILHRYILSGLSNRLRIPNRTRRNELGNVLAISSGISQGKIVDFPPVRTQAEAIAHALGSTGPLNIQGRWDGKQFIPFEINPRFSGTTPMRAIAGVNEPELTINWYLGLSQSPVYSNIKYGEFTRGLVEHFTPES